MFFLHRRQRHPVRRQPEKGKGRRPATRPRLEALEGRWAPAVLTVTTAADSGPGSLRQALLDANSTPGLDTINFAIGSGAQTIALASPLPAVSDSVIIDGTTQPGWAGLPVVTLDGSGAGRTDGLDLTADTCAVRGLTITHFAGSGVVAFSTGAAIQDNFLVGNGLDGATVLGTNNVVAGSLISGNGRVGVFLEPGASQCVIQDNRIGTNAAGTAALPNALDGVQIFTDFPRLARSNLIRDNLISGNGRSGAFLFQAGEETFSGNFIGTNAAGTAAIPNGADGVTLLNCRVEVELAGNLISGNGRSGVLLDRSDDNTVAGNTIGTNAAGSAALPNALDGVTLLDNSTDTHIGGTGAGEGNVISGNGRVGVYLEDTFLTVILGNRIGTDRSGGSAVGNFWDGVTLANGASGNTIQGNLLSGNGRVGALIGGIAGGNVVRGNQIGTNAAGSAALGNARGGVVVYFGASDNSVGGTAAGDGNLIAGNGGPGVVLGDSGLVRDNHVAGNTIGGALGNAGDGVLVFDADENFIGGTDAGAGNVISGNARRGVALVGEGAIFNVVRGNRIGTLADGTTPRGNGSHGVYVADNAVGNQIGGTAAGAGNVIAFNGGDGVRIGLDPAFDTVDAGTGNAVLSNSIHDNVGLGINLGDKEGVTPNDSAGHSGPNNFQNFPVLTAVAAGASGGTDVTFTLDSTPSTAFRVEFFANVAPDPSGFGEGQTFLGAVTATTDPSGHVALTAHVPGAVPAGQTVTATATDPAGNTSEFSADFPPPR
jgi:parallel beta-helix repeat protein